MGPPEGLGDGPALGTPGVDVDHGADPRRRRAAAQGRLPAGTTPAGPGAQGRVRGRADRAEHGLAVRLLASHETTSGGTWRVAGIADYWSKYEFGWHWSPTANQHDAIAAVQLALAETASLLPDGVDLLEHLADPVTGEVVPITLVTDNGGPFRSARFAAFIEATPELDHVRTRVRTPGQNGVRERGFQSLKYERLYREQIDDIQDLVAHSEDFRSGFNTTRPHEALSWNRPREVHLGLADPCTPNFPEAENLPEARHGTHADPGHVGAAGA